MLLPCGYLPAWTTGPPGHGEHGLTFQTSQMRARGLLTMKLVSVLSWFLSAGPSSLMESTLLQTLLSRLQPEAREASKASNATFKQARAIHDLMLIAECHVMVLEKGLFSGIRGC